MPLLHALNQNVCVSHYLHIKCLTTSVVKKKKKSAKNKSVTCGERHDVAGTIKTRQREEFEAVTVCVYHDGAFLRLFVVAFKTNNKQCVKSVDKKKLGNDHLRQIFFRSECDRFGGAIDVAHIQGGGRKAPRNVVAQMAQRQRK
jgi:hypothetical protein